jgi:TonB family protein
MLFALLAWLAPAEIPATPPPPVAPPVIETNAYLSELPKSGITPEMFKRPSLAKANLVPLFSTEDYPLEAIRNEEQGTVAVVLRVAANGRVSDCIVAESSGSPSLDLQTCRVLWSRARFVPARDAQGRPIESAWRQRIRWELPEPEPMPFNPWSSRMTLDFMEDGGVISCRVETSGALKDQQESCGLISDMWQSALGTLRIDAGHARRTLILETQFAPGNRISPGPPPAGARLVGRQTVRMTIDASGKTLQCRVIETEGLEPPNEGCEDLLDGIFEEPGVKVGAVEATMARAAFVIE